MVAEASSSFQVGDPAIASIDPGLAFAAPALQPNVGPTGQEPLLGGALREQAVWVDEAVCIGCRYCAHVAANTFVVEQEWGRSRAIRQDGDSTALIQEAIDVLAVLNALRVPWQDGRLSDYES